MTNYSNIESIAEPDSEWYVWETQETEKEVAEEAEPPVELPDCCLNGDCDIDEELHHVPVLEYITGYILKKFFVQCAQGESKWIQKVSKGGLRIPNKQFNEAIQQLELVFKQNNGCKNIYRGKDFIQYHVQKATHVDLEVPMKNLFFKIRLFARIKLLNQLREEAKKEKILKRKRAKLAKERARRLRARGQIQNLDHRRTFRNRYTKKIKKIATYFYVLSFSLYTIKFIFQ